MSFILLDDRRMSYEFESADDILYIECFEKEKIVHIRTEEKLWATWQTKMSTILLQFIKAELTQFTLVCDHEKYCLVNINRVWGGAGAGNGKSVIPFNLPGLVELRLENEIAAKVINRDYDAAQSRKICADSADHCTDRI